MSKENDKVLEPSLRAKLRRYRHIGILFGKLNHSLRQLVDHGSHGKTNGNILPVLAGEILPLLNGILQLLMDIAKGHAELKAGWRQSGTLAGPFKDFESDLIFRALI